MKLSAFKNYLNNITELNFVLENGTKVPVHFHITEAGLTTKHFVDCGGTERTEKNISFQLWVANDYEHKLSPQKLLSIINIADKLFSYTDLEVEIEYQMDTIGRFGVDFNGSEFVLISKTTDCLAKDKCGIPTEVAEKSTSRCEPNSGCC